MEVLVPLVKSAQLQEPGATAAVLSALQSYKLYLGKLLVLLTHSHLCTFYYALAGLLF